MRKSILAIVLSVFVLSLFAQVTTEDNQKDIQSLQRKIKTYKAQNANLKAKTNLLEKNLSLQGNEIDSVVQVLQSSNSKIGDNKKSLGNVNNQVNQISKESVEITSKMTKTTQYFAISLIVLLILIVLELILLNIKRKKEVNRLAENITGIDSELKNKIQEIQKTLEQKLINSQEKSFQEISTVKSQNEKQMEDTKILINQKNDELKSLLDGFVQKIENDLTEKIASIEAKAEKTHSVFAKDILNSKKSFDDEIVKISQEIEKLAKKINN